MNIEEKTAFEKVIKGIKEIRESRDTWKKIRFTVFYLESLAQNHSFDNPLSSKLFGITEHEGKLIRSYFNKYEEHQYVNDLYREFPDVFEGEYKKRFIDANSIKKLDKNIHLL